MSAGCPNKWHGTAPARARQVCPECPAWLQPATAAETLAVFLTATYGAGARTYSIGERDAAVVIALPTGQAMRFEIREGS